MFRLLLPLGRCIAAVTAMLAAVILVASTINSLAAARNHHLSRSSGPQIRCDMGKPRGRWRIFFDDNQDYQRLLDEHRGSLSNPKLISYSRLQILGAEHIVLHFTVGHHPQSNRRPRQFEPGPVILPAVTCCSVPVGRKVVWDPVRWGVSPTICCHLKHCPIWMVAAKNRRRRYGAGRKLVPERNETKPDGIDYSNVELDDVY